MNGIRANEYSAPEPGEHWRLRPVHTRVTGRARFRVPALRRGDVVKPTVELRLRKLPGIRTIQINTLTGSLLIQFDPRLDLGAVAADIEQRLMDLPVPRVPGYLGQRTRRGGQRGQTLGHPEKLLKRPGARVATRAAGSPFPDGGPPWHALLLEDLCAQLDSSPRGLSSIVATHRLAGIGANSLPQATRRSDLSIFLEQFVSPPVTMLGVSAVIAIMTGGVVDAGAILSVVLINALIGFFTERQSEKIIAALAPTVPREITVLRDDCRQRVPVAQLVPGDVILLVPGSNVAADVRLLQAERLSLDESALTGESLPVEKDVGAVCREDVPLGDRHNMAYMGTIVTGGSGRGLVVGTGLNTELGRIQSLAEAARPPQTVVERQLDELGGQLALLSSASCAGVFLVGLLRGQSGLEMLKTAISLAVAAVPEGLPTVATTTLAMGIREMRRRNVLVRRLDAVETLGSVQVFCLDKTGTLTTNHMRVVALHVGMQDVWVDEQGFGVGEQRIEPLQLREFQRLLEVVASCSEVELVEEGERRLQGSATEMALVELALAGGLDVPALRIHQPRIGIQHRAEDRPYMVTVHRLQDGRRLVAAKGSPGELLAMCRLHLRNGRRRVLSEADRVRVQRANERMAGDALRVLGVAFAVQAKDDADLFKDLIWLGLAGMADPLRPGMTTLLGQFHRAGIDTSIITGDQSTTAYAIAKQLDLADGHALEILDSVSLDKIDPALLSGVIQRVQVFSRVSPAHKLQIVQALQRAGRIVAMTGDGINDGPALKAADLGVAMGAGGAEVARSVADVVIEDDNLATMVVAIRDGRTIYDNIRKAIRFLLSTNLSEIEVMLASLGLGLGRPLNPMQLLWINLATDVFPSLALAMEKPEPDVLERPPRDPARPIIDGKDLGRLGLESAFITGGALLSYLTALLRYGPGAKANTHTFMTLTLAQLLHAFSSRSEEHSILDRERLPPNRYLETALLGSLVAQSLTVLVPGLRRLLGTTPLSLADALIVTAGAAVPLLLNETTKKANVARKSVKDPQTPDPTAGEAPDGSANTP